EMIDKVTSVLPEIKNGSHPKVYAEMMTIQLSEMVEKNSSNIPADVTAELDSLRRELKSLKNEMSQLSRADQSSSTQKVKVNNKTFTFKVDRTKILTIMEETVVDSQRSREYLEALKSAWNEILDNITAQDRALLMGSEPVLANSENAILAFDAAFNAEQAMKRTDLNDIFGNIMSKAAGFSPNILAVPRNDFNQIRSDFAKKMKAQKTETEPEVNHQIPEDFSYLAERIAIVED
ncbi:DNA polymerase III subunit gamma/tau, partial [Streptococcus agalactiae]|nr:DNA polymerase III subunit gamma/tau [Streptococcus agalactiae]MCC9861705.1 DNA polymerase III subunit gamma/tau [Streptococcus agalactiae]MCK6351280.1 DNA polymerase III subunit gamma/tau [Streptococcus agalactiae]